MSDAYDSSFRKIVSLSELPAGEEPAVFRAAGATVVLRRGADGIEAIDGSCLTEEEELTHDQRLEKVMDCVASGAGTAPDEWRRLVERAGLRVKVDEGAVWVCLVGCKA